MRQARNLAHKSTTNLKKDVPRIGAVDVRSSDEDKGSTSPPNLSQDSDYYSHEIR